MKKINYIIDGEEKNQILEMHSKIKKPVISEQVTPDLRQKLTKVLDDGCVKNGNIVSMQTKNPALQLAIKQESTKTPGKFRYFFADNRVGIFDNNGKFQFSPSKWSCVGVQQSANKEDIDRVKKEGNWLEASETKTTRENLENPKMYEKKVVSGVTLYRPVISSGVADGLTDEQKKVLKKYTDLGFKLRKDLDAEEARTWSSKVVYSADSGLFSQDLVMYFDPKNTVGTEENSTSYQIEKKFKEAYDNQTPKSKRDCKDTIETYYEAWRTKKRFEQSQIFAMKEKVQACANQFEGKWGGVLSRIDNYVEILRGDREGGPLSDSKWRIE
jgi:hypothetical protein